MIRLYISIKTNTKPFLRIGPCIIITYVKSSDHYATTRSLNYRKVDHVMIASRLVTEDEYETECTSKYRIEFSKYDDWDKLIQDELKFNPSEDWMATIDKLKKTYPQFKQKAQLDIFNNHLQTN